MTIWSTILLLSVTVITFLLWLRHPRARTNLFTYYLAWITLGSLAAVYLAPLIETATFSPYQANVEFWGRGISISASLTLLSNVIRNLKPSYTRYPIFLTLVPIILLVVFPAIRSYSALMDLLQTMVLGAGIVALWLTSFTLVRKLEKGWVLTLGAAALTGAYILSWVFTDISQAHPWTTHVLLTASLPPLFVSLTWIPEHFKP